MRPVRTGGGGGFSSFFPTKTVAFKLALSLVVASIVVALLGKSGLADWVLLTPFRVLQNFALWQLFTYAFVAIDPLGVIFGGIILWSMGGTLETTWGGKRLAIFVIATAATAAVLTVGASFLVRDLQTVSLPGGGVMTSAVWLAYGWSMGSRQTNFWGIPLTGNMLAGIGILFVALNAIMGSWIWVVPNLFAIPIIYAYVKFGSPMIWITRMRGWLLQRRLRAKSKHLRVVEKDRNVGGGSDSYLH